jgi:hypothetical protein
VGAALCAAIRVTRASTNASPPQENAGQSRKRNAANGAVGDEGRSWGFQRRAHWEVITFRLATSTIKAARIFSWDALRGMAVHPCAVTSSLPPSASASVIVVVISSPSAGSAVSNSTTSKTRARSARAPTDGHICIRVSVRLAYSGQRVVRKRDPERAASPLKCVHVASHAIQHPPLNDRIRIGKRAVDSRAERLHVTADAGRTHARTLARDSETSNTPTGRPRQSLGCRAESLHLATCQKSALNESFGKR